MQTSLQVDQRPGDPRRFAVPEMGLSSARASMVKHHYRLRMAKADVLLHLSERYAAWVGESKADDEACGSPQDELAHAGYPPLRELIEDSRLAELVLGHYLLRELVEAACSTASPATTYWLDTVTDCEVDEDSMVLHGFCYSLAQNKDQE